MGYVGGAPAQMLLFLGMLGVPVLGYSGTSSYLRRRFPRRTDNATLAARVTKISTEAEDIKSFELVGTNGKSLPASRQARTSA